MRLVFGGVNFDATRRHTSERIEIGKKRDRTWMEEDLLWPLMIDARVPSLPLFLMSDVHRCRPTSFTVSTAEYRRRRRRVKTKGAERMKERKDADVNMMEHRCSRLKRRKKRETTAPTVSYRSNPPVLL